jgi:hypothetical protein
MTMNRIEQIEQEIKKEICRLQKLDCITEDCYITLHHLQDELKRELLLAYEQSKCPKTWWMNKNQAENEVKDFIKKK